VNSTLLAVPVSDAVTTNWKASVPVWITDADNPVSGSLALAAALIASRTSATVLPSIATLIVLAPTFKSNVVAEVKVCAAAYEVPGVCPSLLTAAREVTSIE